MTDSRFDGFGRDRDRDREPMRHEFYHFHHHFFHDGADGRRFMPGNRRMEFEGAAGMIDAPQA